MKYIKKFNESNESSYLDITKYRKSMEDIEKNNILNQYRTDSFNDDDCLSIDDRCFNALTKNFVRTDGPVFKPSVDKHFNSPSYLHYRYNSNISATTMVDILIFKVIDDYYYVKIIGYIDDKRTALYYKVDQLPGLLHFLNKLFIAPTIEYRISQVKKLLDDGIISQDSYNEFLKRMTNDLNTAKKMLDKGMISQEQYDDFEKSLQ